MSPFFLFLISLFVMSCARAPIKSTDQAMRLTVAPESIVDDLSFAELGHSLSVDIDQLKKNNSSSLIKFGPVTISVNDYIAGLNTLINALKSDPTGESFKKKIRDEFDFYEVYGDKEWGQVFVTSYYVPEIQGRLRPTGAYTYPLYGVPKDLVSIDAGEYAKVFPTLRPMYDLIYEQKSRDGFLRGRIVANDLQSRATATIEPYYSRTEIEEDSKFKSRARVLCYVDPIDAFFMQTQGSGRVRLPKGKILTLGYAEQNGYQYVSIGKSLLDIIPIEKMSAQKIEKYLRGLPFAEAETILRTNPSYVFFKKLDSEPTSYFGAVVASGRTIATDQRYFPKGALAFLEYEKPVFADDSSDEPTEFAKSSRFVLDQDVGGAIRGPHRVDLFWGYGKDAARMSGVMRNPGRLYYILPKKKAL